MTASSLFQRELLPERVAAMHDGRVVSSKTFRLPCIAPFLAPCFNCSDRNAALDEHFAGSPRISGGPLLIGGRNVGIRGLGVIGRT